MSLEMPFDWIGIAIEVSGRCPSCGAPVMVNAAVLDLLCPSCQSTIAMPRNEWVVVLGRIVREAAQGTRSSGVAMPLGQLVEPNLVWDVEPPQCGKCGAALEMSDAVERALTGTAFCVGCGAPASMRNLHPELTGMAVVAVGEDPDMLPAGTLGTPAPEASRPTHFACSGCGAPLPVDGTRRSVPCDHCQTHAYLPDAVWRRFHPATTVRRWYLWADVGPLRARDAWAVAQQRAGRGR